MRLGVGLEVGFGVDVLHAVVIVLRALVGAAA